MQQKDRLGFVQPFSLSSPGGGARILRALLQNAPYDILSIATHPSKPAKTARFSEVHLPSRPYFGRLERSRLARFLSELEAPIAPRFRQNLRNVIANEKLSALHGVVHSSNCLEAFQVANASKIPFFLSVHDDLAYIVQNQLNQKRILARLAEMWNESNACFVISEEMGEEYCDRYGRRPYVLASDGLEEIATQVTQPSPNQLRVYFMGLFHHSYIPNMKALLAGLHDFAANNPSCEVTLTCRCGDLPVFEIPNGIKLRVLPFASEDVVREEMKSADLLYQPLPFDVNHIGLAKFSLSTKMVSYLGSGILILFHGPSSSAASRLLEKNHAALCVDTLDAKQIAMAVASISRVDRYEYLVSSALALATSQFRLEDIRSRFWSTISESFR